AQLGDHDLHLVGLVALGEDRSQDLRVPVGQAAGGDIGAVVLVSARVRVPDPGDAQVLVLVVAADRGERDPGVDLADLVQRAGGVGGDEQDPLVVLDHDAVAPAGDALAGVVRLVLHLLFRRDIERHGHRWGSPVRVWWLRACAGGPAPCAGGQAMAVATAGTGDYAFWWLFGFGSAPWPHGDRLRSSPPACAYRPASSSVSRRNPSAVMVATTG